MTSKYAELLLLLLLLHETSTIHSYSFSLSREKMTSPSDKGPISIPSHHTFWRNLFASCPTSFESWEAICWIASACAFAVIRITSARPSASLIIRNFSASTSLVIYINLHSLSFFKLILITSLVTSAVRCAFNTCSLLPLQQLPVYSMAWRISSLLTLTALMIVVDSCRDLIDIHA